MKSVTGFSLGMVIATVLFFASSALGQTARVSVATGAPASSTMLLSDHGSSNVCSTEIVGTWRWQDSRWNRRIDTCMAVPEGGSAMIYLLLCGLVCSGAVVLRSKGLNGADGR
jgi:hypothetical protein